jgi:Domain of unknown function (DUF4157)
MTATASRATVTPKPVPKAMPPAPKTVLRVPRRDSAPTGQGPATLLPDVSRVPVDPQQAPAAAWPTPVQRCGIGSSCDCPPHEKLAGIQRDLRRSTAGGGTPLPSGTQAMMTQALGADFAAVRVHTGPGADHVAATLQARALTAGTDILFLTGAYRPGTPGGDRLLAHELTHVAQQARGMPSSGLDGGAADPLEAAATRAAGQVVPARHEVPIVLPEWERQGLTAGSHPAAISMLGAGRSLTPAESRAFPGWSDVLDHVRVHDDLEAQLVAALVGDAGLAAGHDIVLGHGSGRSADRDWLLAHELTHVMQQRAVAPRPASSDPEREAQRVADLAVRGDRGVTLARPAAAPVGLAEAKIFEYTKDLPNNMLLVIDVDDGDFVGGCVRAIVPHVGVKVILKGVPKAAGNQLFNIHAGIMTNPAGETCFFFYESVTGLCEMKCFPTLDELKKAIGELRDWLEEKIEQLLKALLPAAAAALLAYLIANAIVAALAAGGIVVLA